MPHAVHGWKLTNSYTSLPAHFYTMQQATKVKQANLFLFNKELAADLEISDEFEHDERAANFLAGQLPEYYEEAMALAYAGHQFGYFNKLGDGRALLLGEQKGFDIQLKGSGRTPYSRNGDGKAALGPMLREYIMSEAMHGLGIPTTRSLAMVTTGEAIVREQYLPGAILTRVAKSHLRVGTFEYAAKFGEAGDVAKLADYAISRHFPELAGDEKRYLKMAHEVARRQGKLIASWDLVGFIHGVMNTDNMTISGETIDYGPCAFMNRYDPKTVYSSIDSQGRYAFENQANIGSWNVMQLLGSMLPLFSTEEEEAVKLAQAVMNSYSDAWHNHYFNGMRAKLGLMTEEAGDEQLIISLLQWMYDEQLDYTNTFVDLTLRNFIRIDSYQKQGFLDWKQTWKTRLAKELVNEQESLEQMKKVNPIVIPRNEWVEETLLDAEKTGNSEKVYELIILLKSPFAYTTEQRLKYVENLNENANYQTYCGT